MKRVIILFGLWMACSSISGQQVVRAEYFIDTDPGFGNGSSIELIPGSQISIMLTIPLENLEPGLHNLYVRVEDSNSAWSQTLQRPFLLQRLPVNLSPDIIRMEYFFDEDPGFGMAIPIAFQAGAYISIGLDLPLETMTDGVHTLFIRALDSNGSWGMTLCRNFLIQELPQNRQYKLTRMEYFFDEDPGFGQGSPIEFQSDSKTSVSIDLPLETLTDGVHNLYIRAKDDKGSWGMTFQQIFMKFYTPADHAKIAGMEYFVNTDPGFGNGTRIDLNTPKPATMKYFVVDPEKLQAGKNTLFVRALDTRGTWGHVYTAEFEVLETAACEPPSDLLANDVTESTASLGWTSGGGSSDYDIMWVPADLDYTEDGTLDTAIQDNPYAAQELLQSTLYGFYVRTICSDGQVSNWAGPGMFHTLPLPLNQLTLLADPPEGGTFTGAGSYAWNEKVNISAIPNDHFEFEYWSGDTDYLDNTGSADAIVTMPASAVTLTAHFLDRTGIGEDPESSLRIFPNPAGERLWVEYYKHGGESVTIQLVEMRGRVVEQQVLEETGIQRVWFDTSDLPSGLYLLKIHGDRWTATRKVIMWH